MRNANSLSPFCHPTDNSLHERVELTINEMTVPVRKVFNGTLVPSNVSKTTQHLCNLNIIPLLQIELSKTAIRTGIWDSCLRTGQNNLRTAPFLSGKFTKQ